MRSANPATVRPGQTTNDTKNRRKHFGSERDLRCSRQRLMAGAPLIRRHFVRRIVHQKHGGIMKNHSFHSSSRVQAEALTTPYSESPVPWVGPRGPLRRIAQLAVFLLAVHMLTGCASAQSVSNDSTFSISSLETALQKEGVFVMPRGLTSLDIPADQRSRLLLNSSEVLNVFEFDSAEKAHRHAYAFAGAHPRHDVYHKGSVVAVRQSARDTGLNSTLRLILGEAL